MATKRRAAPKKASRKTVKRPARKKSTARRAKPAARKTAKRRVVRKPAAKPKAAPRRASPSARTAPSNAKALDTLTKKVTSVSDTTAMFAKDLKVISKIFADNQKILVSMKDMMGGIAGALDAIQKQSKRIGTLETDTQRIFSGIKQLDTHSRMIAKLDAQASKLQDTVKGINERSRTSGGIESIAKKVDESFGSIKNNSEMIIKIGRHIDGIRDDIGGLADRTSSLKATHEEINKLKKILESGGGMGGALSAEIATLAKRIAAVSQIPTEISDIQKRLTDMGTGSTLSPLVEELRTKIGQVASKVESYGTIKSEFASLREEMLGRTGKVESGITSVSESLSRAEKSASDFHAKADALFEEMRGLKGDNDRTSGTSASEVMALLQLSEFQSNVRMTSESKYGDVEDLERIAVQTVDVLNVFDKLAVETGTAVRLPQGVRQWAVSKIIECADRWEIRFSDILGVLQEKLGATLLKDSIRMNQVRELYGVRAVDELKSILGES